MAVAADLSYWMGIAGRAAFAVFFAATSGIVCVAFISTCTLEVKTWWRSRRMRLFRLGSVTTLRRRLSYRCTLCQDSMEAGEKVRTLSCGHVFHCGGGVKCEDGIDNWLVNGQATSWRSCPICRQDPRPVLPWKRPPPSSPAPSPSAPASTTSTADLVEPLLLPVHDETLPEASSSAPAPPLAQSPPTSTRDLEAAPPPAAHDETPPEASPSQ